MIVHDHIISFAEPFNHVQINADIIIIISLPVSYFPPVTKGWNLEMSMTFHAEIKTLLKCDLHV